jgi:hypothetical protein
MILIGFATVISDEALILPHPETLYINNTGPSGKNSNNEKVASSSSNNNSKSSIAGASQFMNVYKYN